ncbi:probable inactive receptor kinase At1g48480 isoform X2 [Abrus precatorius]|uniref:Probable inactive receptor kinase At1g48480 isoform X2 n=1 Tax=Abrus precatorius TaxID=3816 RepID=A0A8B8LRT6_ABRPR|nr:probable inactive receptor kinase At1g48480 isoform X2 [Abrus precatorius]
MKKHHQQNVSHKFLPSTILILLFCFFPFAKPDLTSERAALLTLRSAVRGRTLLWNASSSSPCIWPGVQCDVSNVTVVELHLPAVALSGELPAGVFSKLPNLHTLSLRVNALSGVLPADLASCVKLRNFYLQRNEFSGEVPAFFSGMTGLVRLNLASNNFSGRVPVGFGNLTRLRTLFLENNRFTGSLPELKELNELAQFNVSYNMLNGSVPRKLQTFTKDSFLGNTLCGKPLALCPWDDGGSENGANGTSNSSGVGGDEGKVIEGERKKKSKLSGGAIAGIVIGCVVVLLLVVFALILLCRNKSGSKTRSVDSIVTMKQQEKHDGGEVGIEGENVESGDGNGNNGYSVAAAAVAAMSGSGDKKLVFFGNSVKVFDLEDLLRASAEVLGKGTYGTAYKAVLEDGPVVAVKRLKDVTISEKEFKEKIEGVGAMDHENLVPLRAYYYSRDEKLLVHDYMPMGSLSALLHGNKGAGRTPLNWEMRSSIALGAARGIEYLHSQGPNVSHGNIKSSNILLTKSYDPKVSDFGLAQLVGPSSSTPNRVAGYRAPEVTDPRKVSQKADVYSFGVLLLELLTGKAPTHALLNEEGVDLPRWVQSVVREEWTSEVFDIELLRYHNVEEEMVQLLQLAVDCAATYPDNRPSMSQVRQRIEELCRSSLKEGTQDQTQQSDFINDIDDVSSR